MNPRYRAYLATNPEKPSNVGFMCWVRDAWNAWGTEVGHRRDSMGFLDFISDDDHRAFDAWLPGFGPQVPRT
jgi:hypothetical protein